jgi:hypothetical protein
VEFAILNGNTETTHKAGGLLDTGCPVTLVDIDFVKCQLLPAGASIECFLDGPIVIFNSVNGKPVEEGRTNGNEVKAIGILRMPARCSPSDPADTRPRFRIHGDASFGWWGPIYVSEHPIGGTQILMGANYIEKYYALIRRFGAPGFAVSTSSSKGLRPPMPKEATSKLQTIS